MKTNKLENFLFLPGVSSKIEWALVERFLPLYLHLALHLSDLEPWGTLLPTPMKCFFALPSSFAAAAVAPKDYRGCTVCTFSYFGTHIPGLCLDEAELGR